MQLELLTVGTELLLGHTVDTNSAEIGRRAAAAGVRVVRRTSVGDAGPEIAEALAAALGRTGAVLSTGGLGPTSDDITKAAVCERLGLALRFDPQVWDRLVARFTRLGRTPSPANRSQAMVPEGAVVLPNRWGTAPGLWLEGPWGLAILLPGVPLEMRMLLEHEVMPRLGDVERQVHPATLAYLPGVEGVDIRLTAWRLPADEADALLDRAARLVAARAGEHAYAEGDVTLAEVVVGQLRERRWRVALGESCTGGLLAGRLTDVPGSSAVLDGAVVAYANVVKERELGVPTALLAEHGAVSEPVAAAMASGARSRFGADVGVGVTGIAGPGGGTPDKPVGTVCFGLADDAGVSTSRLVLPGSRGEVRARAVQAALFLLLQRLRSSDASAIGTPI